MDTIDHRITATLIPNERRLDTLPHYFGASLTKAELLVYQWMGTLCPEYRGGYWEFYALSNGGFYMAPGRDGTYTVGVVMNSYLGTMSADAAGLTACLFAFCELANAAGPEQEHFVDLYHLLREYAIGHAEACEMLSAID